MIVYEDWWNESFNNNHSHDLNGVRFRAIKVVSHSTKLTFDIIGVKITSYKKHYLRSRFS